MKKVFLGLLTLIFTAGIVFAYYTPTNDEAVMVENLSKAFVFADKYKSEHYVDTLYRKLKIIQITYVQKYGYGYERGEVLISKIMDNVEQAIPRLKEIGWKMVESANGGL